MINLNELQTFIKKLNSREKAVFYGSIIVVCLAVMDRLVINPAVSRVASLNKEVAQQKINIKKNLYFLSLKDKVSKEVSKYESYFKEAPSSEEEMTSLLKLIEGFASKSAVYLVYSKPAGFKSEGSQKRYYIDLNCEGTMPQLLNFVYQIENSNKIMYIDKMSFSLKSEGSNIVQCRLSIIKLGLSL